jgi:hypothetical protein
MERVWHVRTRLDAAAPSGKGAYHNAFSVGRGFQLLQVHPQCAAHTARRQRQQLTKRPFSLHSKSLRNHERRKMRARVVTLRLMGRSRTLQQTPERAASHRPRAPRESWS